MSNAFLRASVRQTLFGIFVLFVFGTTLGEIIYEFSQGESLGSMADDLFRFLLSLAIMVMFVYEIIIQRNALTDLRTQLEKAKGGLARIDKNSLEIASQYRAVMQKQFDAWNLTASEQDVVIMLLKGLSFREIAELRETREKTVRQQASSVYRKAGVSSRNELAAWFFEDVLEPPNITN